MNGPRPRDPWATLRLPVSRHRVEKTPKCLTLSIDELQVLGQEGQGLGVSHKARGALETQWKVGSWSLEIVS